MGGGENASQPRRRQTERKSAKEGERGRGKGREPKTEAEGATNCPRKSTHAEIPVRVHVGCYLQART